jgi:hypothetical protein
MERNPVITDQQLETAVAALAEIAAGGGVTAASPDVRVRAAETLLAHALIFPAAEEA